MKGDGPSDDAIYDKRADEATQGPGGPSIRNAESTTSVFPSHDELILTGAFTSPQLLGRGRRAEPPIEHADEGKAEPQIEIGRLSQREGGETKITEPKLAEEQLVAAAPSSQRLWAPRGVPQGSELPTEHADHAGKAEARGVGPLPAPSPSPFLSSGETPDGILPLVQTVLPPLPLSQGLWAPQGVPQGSALSALSVGTVGVTTNNPPYGILVPLVQTVLPLHSQQLHHSALQHYHHARPGHQALPNSQQHHHGAPQRQHPPGGGGGLLPAEAMSYLLLGGGETTSPLLRPAVDMMMMNQPDQFFSAAGNVAMGMQTVSSGYHQYMPTAAPGVGGVQGSGAETKPMVAIECPSTRSFIL